MLIHHTLLHTSAGLFFAVSAPSVSQQSFTVSLVNLTGAVPALMIQGFKISLAGLVLPLLIALFACRQISLQSIPRSGWIALVASVLINLVVVASQAYDRFPGGGVHLVPVGLFLLLLDNARTLWPPRIGKPRYEYIGKPGGVSMVLVLTFFGMLLPDAVGGAWMGIQIGLAPTFGLQWVGGAGWDDGLLLTVVAVAVIGNAMNYAVRWLFSESRTFKAAPALA
jgi:hypothetical protein